LTDATSKDCGTVRAAGDWARSAAVERKAGRMRIARTSGFIIDYTQAV
jgi:hypothetical protein